VKTPTHYVYWCARRLLRRWQQPLVCYWTQLLLGHSNLIVTPRIMFMLTQCES
jgi:hypothetical protein